MESCNSIETITKYTKSGKKVDKVFKPNLKKEEEKAMKLFKGIS